MEQTTLTSTRFTVEPGKWSVIMTSTFDAPVEKVYRVYVDRELIPRWWGPG